MRIVIDARLYGLEHAGPGRYVKNLIDSLNKIDKINVYFILLRKSYFGKVNLGKNFNQVIADYKHYTFAEQLKLPFLMAKLKPDLVHFPFFNTPVFYFGKFVVTVHDLTMHTFKGGAATTRSYLKNLIWRVGYRIAFANAVFRAKKIIVPSDFVKEDIKRCYKINPKKIVVTYEGVTKSLAKPPPVNVLEKYKIRKPYFIYSGSAYPHKNLDRAIEAIKLLNVEKKGVILIITSPRNIFADRLNEKIKSLNAEKFVKYIGFVTDSELGSLFSHSIGFLYPTLSEGFGLPGLEAMQAQTLVIASDIPVLKEVYKNNAIYFNPENPDSIKTAIQRASGLVDDKRKQRIEKAFNYTKNFNWEKTAYETLDVYNEAIQSGKVSFV